MRAWLDRSDTYPGWRELTPYIGEEITVEYRRWEGGRWTEQRSTDEQCTGVLCEVTDEAVAVNEEHIPYTERSDAFTRRKILRIRTRDHVIFERSSANLKRPGITDEDLIRAKLNPAAHVPSWCVRADGEH